MLLASLSDGYIPGISYIGVAPWQRFARIHDATTRCEFSPRANLTRVRCRSRKCSSSWQAVSYTTTIQGRAAARSQYVTGRPAAVVGKSVFWFQVHDFIARSVSSGVMFTQLKGVLLHYTRLDSLWYEFDVSRTRDNLTCIHRLVARLSLTVS